MTGQRAAWRALARAIAAMLEPYQHHVLRSTFSPARARRNHVLLGVLVQVLNAGVYALIARGGAER